MFFSIVDMPSMNAFNEGLPEGTPLNQPSSHTAITRSTLHTNHLWRLNRLTQRDQTAFLQGVVQGSEVASAGWSVVSKPVINLMKSASYGFLHWSAIAIKVVQIVCFTFVDDTADLVHTAEYDATGEDIYEEMQDVLDTWEGGLKDTGGDLIPNKSYKYLIDLKCGPNGKYSCWKIKEVPGELTLPIPDEYEQVTFKRLEVIEARKALGSRSCHDGKETDYVKCFRDKPAAWPSHVCS
jgi:hypothetical protein